MQIFITFFTTTRHWTHIGASSIHPTLPYCMKQSHC